MMMKVASQQPTELIPLNLIRTETALSRYPIHRLAKKGKIEIEIRNREAAFKWEVSYNSKYGQPGPLAYKVDTLIINRRIEEAGRPTPKIIKLGSLREISDEVGTGKNNNQVIKKALMQNVGALITARIQYKGADKTERTAEFADTRYGVVFTGEKLPDGREADAVYIILHDWYREILDTAQTRPLDYDYLKDLRPAAQRLYELISFQMYGAIEGERKRAKFLYSEFCTFAPQTRYFDFEHVKKQMYKLHLQHKKSGYITAVHFNEIVDNEGKVDWEMFYTPGLKARGEHLAAKRRTRTRRPRQIELPLTTSDKQQGGKKAPAPQEQAGAFTDEQKQFIEKLRCYGVAKIEAEKLVTNKLEACRLKIPAIPYLPEGQGKQNRAGNIRAFIERDDWQIPWAYFEDQNKGKGAAQAKGLEEARQKAVKECTLCDDSGWRMVKRKDSLKGAAKRCSHDPETEKKYPAA
jgi:Replication initiator protein A